jgi:hypothetical protein
MDGGQFFVEEQISPRQAVLPSGTLWCRDCVIARTGDQIYHRHELLGINTDGIADRNGMVRVARDADQVFDPAAMSSFEGAAVTLGHPEGMVDPSTWQQLAVGHAQNIRRSGPHLIADLLIHDARAIHAIRDLGWRALSCGYDAEYLPSRGGLKQTTIRGNHIALLSPGEEARCGGACAVGDSTRRDTMRRRTRDQSVMGEQREWAGSPTFNVGMGADPGGRPRGPQSRRSRLGTEHAGRARRLRAEPVARRCTVRAAAAAGHARSTATDRARATRTACRRIAAQKRERNRARPCPGRA